MVLLASRQSCASIIGRTSCRSFGVSDLTSMGSVYANSNLGGESIGSFSLLGLSRDDLERSVLSIARFARLVPEM